MLGIMCVAAVDFSSVFCLGHSMCHDFLSLCNDIPCFTQPYELANHNELFVANSNFISGSFSKIVCKHFHPHTSVVPPFHAYFILMFP